MCARHIWLGCLWVVLLGLGCIFVTLGISSRDWIQNDNATLPQPAEPDDYTSCTNAGCAYLDYKVCSSCYTELISESLCDAKEDATGDRVCGWLPSAGSCVGCDMLTTDALCSATTNCAWDSEVSSCKSIDDTTAAAPPVNTWGIACTDGRQQVATGFHSCGLWQYSTSPANTADGITCQIGTIKQRVFGGESVCVASFGSAVGTSNPNQLWSIAASLATTGVTFMWFALGGGYVSIFYRDYIVLIRYVLGIATVLCTTGTLLFLVGIKDSVPTNATNSAMSAQKGELDVCRVCRGAGPMASGADCHLGVGSIMMVLGCVLCLVASLLGFFIPDGEEDLPPPKLLSAIKSLPKLLKTPSKTGKVTPAGTITRENTEASATSSIKRVKVLEASKDKATVLSDTIVGGGDGGGGGGGGGGADVASFGGTAVAGQARQCANCSAKTLDGKVDVDTAESKWYCIKCWVEWEAATAAAASTSVGSAEGAIQAAGLLKDELPSVANAGSGDGAGAREEYAISNDGKAAKTTLKDAAASSNSKGTDSTNAKSDDVKNAHARMDYNPRAEIVVLPPSATTAVAAAAAAANAAVPSTTTTSQGAAGSGRTTLLSATRTPAELVFAAGAAEHNRALPAKAVVPSAVVACAPSPTWSLASSVDSEGGAAILDLGFGAAADSGDSDGDGGGGGFF